MSEIDYINAQLVEAGVVLSGPAIESPIEENKYHVFIDGRLNDKLSENALKSVLSKLRADLAAKGRVLEFVISGRDYSDIELVVKSIAERTVSGVIENCLVEFSGSSFTIWLVPNRPLLDIEISSIEERIRAYMDSFDLKLLAVYSTITDHLPSKYALLSFIRIKSPVRVEDLSSGMTEKGFSIPTVEWLSKNLDNLRKAGLVLRLKSGRYALTLSALKALGSAKNASSPDIARMLDLARRGD